MACKLLLCLTRLLYLPWTITAAVNIFESAVFLSLSLSFSICSLYIHICDDPSLWQRTVEHPITLFLWPDLAAGRAYNFSVRACSDLVDHCGLWSDDVQGTTMIDRELDGGVRAASFRSLELPSASLRHLRSSDVTRRRWQLVRLG